MMAAPRRFFFKSWNGDSAVKFLHATFRAFYLKFVFLTESGSFLEFNFFLNY